MAEEYDQIPTLEETDTNEEITLYFNDFNEVAEDYTVEHHPPRMKGSIEQDMGRGSQKFQGSLEISKQMHSNGLKGYKETLRAFARSEYPLKLTLDNGEVYFVTLREPNFNKSEKISPNKIKVGNIVLSEIDQ